MMKLILLAFMVFFPLTSYSSPDADNLVILYDDLAEKNISSRLLILSETDNLYSFEDVTSKNFNWVRNNEESVSLGYIDKSVWFKFDYIRSKKSEKDFILEIDFPPLDEIDMYVPLTDGKYRIIKTGDHRGFSSSDIKYMTPLFSLRNSSAKGTVYFRVKTLGSFRFVANILSTEAYIERISNSVPVYWIFFGMMLVILLYNTALLAATLERSYLFFIIHSVGAIGHQFSIHGLGYQYIWQDSPYVADRAIPFFMLLSLFAITIFISGILRLKEIAPRINRVLIIFSAVPQAALLAVSMIFPIKIIMTAGLIHLIFILIPVNVIAITIGIIKKERYAWFLICGFSILGLSTIPSSLLALGIIQISIVAKWGIDVGMTIFMVILSFGLQDRVIIIRNNLRRSEEDLKDKYDELNATYEELQATNEELEALYSELVANRNELIDKDRMISVLMDSDPNPMYVVDGSGSFILVNTSICVALGMEKEKIIGRNRDEIVQTGGMTEKTAELFMRYEGDVRIKGQNISAEVNVVFYDKRERIFLITAAPFEFEGYSGAVLVVCTDITKKKILEKSLELAQKMETMGTLTSGIVHDFNNIIQAIRGNAELLKLYNKKSGFKEQIIESIRQIDSACCSAAELSKQILLIGRKIETPKKAISVNDIILNTWGMFKRITASGITLSHSLDQEDPYIMAESSRIEQVLLNLIINARDALGDRGSIIISTALVDAEYGDNKNVILSVEDTGHGMSEDIKNKIFEPFFTTKPEGKGTGLGMAIVLGIVQSYSGTIECSSVLGKGTRFDIKFPFVSHTTVSSMDSQRMKETDSEEYNGEGKIIIVDDDNSTTIATKGILEKSGYQVISFRSGEELFEYLNSEDTDLIITDLNLPGISGWEVSLKLLKHDKHIPVIMVSGQLGALDEMDKLPENINAFMYKPIIYIDLLKIIKTVIVNKP